MRQVSYLKVILTVNAILLAGLLWTQVVGTTVLDSTAAAQSRTVYSRPPGGIPNAGRQRDELISTMREVQRSADATRKLLESGRLQVTVTNLDDITIEVREQR